MSNTKCNKRNVGDRSRQLIAKNARLRNVIVTTVGVELPLEIVEEAWKRLNDESMPFSKIFLLDDESFEQVHELNMSEPKGLYANIIKEVYCFPSIQENGVNYLFFRMTAQQKSNGFKKLEPCQLWDMSSVLSLLIQSLRLTPKDSCKSTKRALTS
jgi:hypothetical protein